MAELQPARGNLLYGIEKDELQGGTVCGGASSARPTANIRLADEVTRVVDRQAA